jgi:hypothetical protein
MRGRGSKSRKRIIKRQKRPRMRREKEKRNEKKTIRIFI